MKLLMTAFTALFLGFPTFANTDCTCDHHCSKSCDKAGHKECKCECGCAKTGKCKHGKCHGHDKGAAPSEETK